MKRLKVLFGDRLVGELLEQAGVHYFSYDADWLKAPLPLSPYELPAEPGVSEHRQGHFLTLPGLCYDSLPDRFGMAVLRYSLGNQGILNPTPLQMLAYLGCRTMGALSYAPSSDEPDHATAVNLLEAAHSARQLMLHEHGERLDPAIVQAGATAGGMMPKILAAISKDGSQIITGAHHIPDDMEAWLIKLNTNEKKYSQIIQLEHAYLAMARAAGLRVPETRLLHDRNGLKHFAIRRFDRNTADSNMRIHCQTFASLAGIDYREPTTDYEQLLRLTKQLTRNHQEVCEQFRRMLFNVLGCNRDDHAKNFSFCMSPSGEWTVSPAYDLLYTDNELGGNWMTVQGKRNAINKSDFARLATLMGINPSTFTMMLDEVKDSLQRWMSFAKKSGVGAGLSRVVDSAIRNTVQLF